MVALHNHAFDRVVTNTCDPKNII